MAVLRVALAALVGCTLLPPGASQPPHAQHHKAIQNVATLYTFFQSDCRGALPRTSRAPSHRRAPACVRVGASG